MGKLAQKKIVIFYLKDLFTRDFCMLKLLSCCAGNSLGLALAMPGRWPFA